MRRIKHCRKWLTHAMAECKDCDWYDEDWRTAQKTGRYHAIKTGHRVHIEIAYAQYYNEANQ